VSAIRKIKHEVCGRDTNIARGEAECYISIEATRQVLYLRIAQARQCFYCVIEFLSNS